MVRRQTNHCHVIVRAISFSDYLLITHHHSVVDDTHKPATKLTNDLITIQDWAYKWKTTFKGALSGLRQSLATESPLKMIKNAFYFTLKALFVLKIFKFLS